MNAQYDADLQMFVVPSPPDSQIVRRLQFHRWLAERGRYAADLGPDQRCRACDGTHAFRIQCALELEALAGGPGR